MKTVEVEFETSFTGEVMYKHLARIYIGGYCGRLALCPDGKIRMSIDKAAVDNGFLILEDYKEDIELTGFGFGIGTKT